MRKSRIFQWIGAVIAAIILFYGEQYVENLPEKPVESEKQVITVNAPQDMEEAFNVVLEAAGLAETHRIVMTNDDNSNICVGYEKQNDESYQKIAFTPFVVAYSNSSNYEKELKNAEVFVESSHVSGLYEIDFLKIINEAIGDGKWTNFGVKDDKKLEVFYPSETSIYWHDFHDFLLLTVNNGRYPKTEAEMQNAEEIIEAFVNSEYTEGITDFYEKVERTGGFPDSAIYILTEKDALDISENKSKYAELYYPINTVYFNYYIKGDETGKKIIDALDKRVEGILSYRDFYGTLADKRYRSSKNSKLTATSSNVNNEGDVYNVVQIPKIVEFTATETTPTNPTEATIPTSE